MSRYPLSGWFSELEQFDPERDELDPAVFRRVYRLASRVADYFSARLLGAERVPAEGGVLLVTNHGTWGVESPALFARLYETTGRTPRPLAEHLLVKLPGFGRLLRQLGAVDGNPDNAVKLLQAGHLVVVYPGGHRDSLKAPEDQYRLKWQRSRGYVRCAIRARAPILPVAGIGVDETFLNFGRERLLGRLLFGRRDYDLPLVVGLGPLPFPVKLTFCVGEPIVPEVDAELAADDEVVEALHERVVAEMESLLARERRRRFRPDSD